MKKVFLPLLMVSVLAFIPYVGVHYAGLGYLFGVVLPYLAMAVLLGGFLFRMVDWLRRPVPFCIPSTILYSNNLRPGKIPGLDPTGQAGKSLQLSVCSSAGTH